MANYKIKIEKIYPDISEKKLFENKECILGISMGNPVFWRSSLKQIVEWTSTHFKITNYVIADYLHRYSELFYNIIDEKEAISKSLLLGDSLEGKLKVCLKKVDTEKYKITRWKDIYKEKIFIKEVEAFFNLYSENKLFFEAINVQAKNYIKSLKDRNIPIRADEEFAITCSAKYLVEELAVFSKMMETGNAKVLCYPGIQLPIFISMAEGKYHDIIPTLSDDIYVHLKVIKR